MGTVSDEMATSLDLPATARAANRARSAIRRFRYEVRHPENHKQLVRFLCVGASGYVINLVAFTILIHGLGAPDKLSFVLAAVIASTSNFIWNRHWTFAAKEDHPFRQGVRFFSVSFLVLLTAAGIYSLLVGLGLDWKVLADGIAWVIATPLSFVAQKLWSFRA
jgi:putative flippase GtrA